MYLTHPKPGHPKERKVTRRAFSCCFSCKITRRAFPACKEAWRKGVRAQRLEERASQCVQANSTALASQAQRLYACFPRGAWVRHSIEAGHQQGETGKGAAMHKSLRSRSILGILGTMVPPPKTGGPDGSSHYTCDLPPPFGRARSGRPGFNRQCHTGIPHISG